MWIVEDKKISAFFFLPAAKAAGQGMGTVVLLDERFGGKCFSNNSCTVFLDKTVSKKGAPRTNLLSEKGCIKDKTCQKKKGASRTRVLSFTFV